jgi:hypothetical protein
MEWSSLAPKGERSRRSRAVRRITIMGNSLFNGWRFEDASLGQ